MSLKELRLKRRLRNKTWDEYKAELYRRALARKERRQDKRQRKYGRLI